MQKEYLFTPGLLKDWTSHHMYGWLGALFFASGSQHFFPAFCELQTSIKREAGQDIFHGIFAN